MLALECLQPSRISSVIHFIRPFIHNHVAGTELRQGLTLEIMDSMVEKWAAHDLQPYILSP